MAGGVLAGTRTASFIIEVASNDELDQVLEGVPFWGIMKTSVAPLQSFAKRAAQDRKLMEMIKSAGQ